MSALLAGPTLLPLTVADAARLLKTPVFGDALCIEAQRLLMLAEELKVFRDQLGPSEYYPDPIETRTLEQIKGELRYWRLIDHCRENGWL